MSSFLVLQNVYSLSTVEGRTGATPITFILWLSTAQCGLTGRDDTRYVQPAQVSLARSGQYSQSNQSNQIRLTKPGKISTTRPGQSIQVRSVYPGQVSTTRSDQSGPVQIQFNFTPFFSFQLQVVTTVQSGPICGSVQFFPRSVQVSRCQGYRLVRQGL